MTNYPVTDPAEIAKLPDGIYQSVVGIAYWKQGERWFLNPNYAMDVGWQTITTTGGGIAARLVPEAQYELIRTQLEEHHASMKAQRDRAVELLRSWRYHFDQCTFECGEPGRCPNCDTLNFLAEQQPCQRCGGEGWEDTKDYDDLGPMVYKPCSDCQGGAS